MACSVAGPFRLSGLLSWSPRCLPTYLPEKGIIHFRNDMFTFLYFWNTRRWTKSKS